MSQPESFLKSLQNKIKSFCQSKKDQLAHLPQKKQRLIYIIFFNICLAVFLVCFGIIAYNRYQQSVAEKQLALLASQQTVTESADASADAVQNVLETENIIPKRELSWVQLKLENSDIYGWLVVPGTEINTPIMTTSEDEDEDFYLNHNFDKTKGYPGCIYSQRTYNKTDFTDFNLVLYGHIMRNGTGFTSLHEYEDPDFFHENQYIYVYTKDKNYAYRIFAAYARDNMHIIYYNDFESEEGQQSYLNVVMSNTDPDANIATDIIPTSDDQIITLSTCVQNEEEQRYVVQGVLVETQNNVTGEVTDTEIYGKIKDQ